VESRRCLLRCAATGETCVISPVGTILARLPLHTKEVLTADVPLLEGHTLYRMVGPAFPIACGLALALIMFQQKRRGPRPSARHRDTRMQ
jgi:apolipoprotein N-acyltransferase